MAGTREIAITLRPLAFSASATVAKARANIGASTEDNQLADLLRTLTESVGDAAPPQSAAAHTN